MYDLSIIIPAFNEKECITELIGRIYVVMKKMQYSFEIIIIDDGSSDETIIDVKSLAEHFHNLFFIQLSRNFGHQSALKAGLDHSSGRAVISMDADLQHPTELIPVLLEKWEEGFDIVSTCRRDDKSLSWFKRKSSSMFYKCINSISEVHIIPGAADFRLLSRKVVNVLKDFGSSDMFFRGLVSWLGFNTTTINYTPNPRYAGKSKYSLKGMIRFAVQGITSFSIRPLYAAIYIGISMAIVTLLYFPYALWQNAVGHTVSGWTSLIMTIIFFGGLQLIVTGILGIYIGKMFIHIKNRPAYIIKEHSLPERQSAQNTKTETETETQKQL